MGRPRQYATPAERQAAYRHRLQDTTVLVDRQTLEQLDTRLALLQEAVAPLARRGDPLAQRVSRTSLVTLLDILTEWFQEQEALGTTRPAVDRPPLPRASRLGFVRSSNKPR